MKINLYKSQKKRDRFAFLAVISILTCGSSVLAGAAATPTPPSASGAGVVPKINTILVGRLEQIGREMEGCATPIHGKASGKTEGADQGGGVASGCQTHKIAAYVIFNRRQLAGLVDYRGAVMIFQKPDENEPLPLEIGKCYMFVSHVDPNQRIIGYKSFKLTGEAKHSIFETDCNSGGV